MSSLNYLHEKVTVAVTCLCGDTGTFEERLYNAFISALCRLDSSDPTVELADDLNWIRLVCKQHLVPSEERMSDIPELERGKIAEKLISLLVKSSRMTD